MTDNCSFLFLIRRLWCWAWISIKADEIFDNIFAVTGVSLIKFLIFPLEFISLLIIVLLSKSKSLFANKGFNSSLMLKLASITHFFSFNFFSEEESPPRKSTEKFKLKLKILI